MTSQDLASQASSQTVDRALAVLDAVAAIGPCRLADLVQKTGIERRILGRLLSSLGRFGLVDRQTSGGRYELGHRLVELGRVAEERNDLLKRARPELEKLMALTSSTTILHRVEARHIAPMLILTPPDVLSVSYPPNRKIGLEEGTGRAALAWMDAERIAAVMGALTPEAQERCRSGLAEVRQGGVAYSFGEVVRGVHAIGAAVRDGEGEPLAVLAVVAPEGHRPERFTEELRIAAERVAAMVSG